MKKNIPPKYPEVPIVGEHEVFPVHQIYCVGRNYGKHIAEMGYKNTVQVPLVLFLKPSEAAVLNGGKISIPDFTENYQHEVELVIAIGKEGKNISKKNALENVFGYSVGIDLTCRDLQAEAKLKGRPWTLAKSLQNSAPVSDITKVESCGHMIEGNIQLSVNGTLRQSSNLNEMIRSVSDIISEISTYYTLYPGDLIFSGTPEGVSKLERGDEIIAEIEGLQPLEISIK